MTLYLDKLWALWEKATPGKWTLHNHSATTVIGDDHTVANTGGYSTTERDMYEELVANASLIVSMKNGLPELLKLARGTAHARREALEGARSWASAFYEDTRKDKYDIMFQQGWEHASEAIEDKIRSLNASPGSGGQNLSTPDSQESPAAGRCREEARLYLQSVIDSFGPDDEVTMNQETWSRVHRSIVAMLAAAEGK